MRNFLFLLSLVFCLAAVAVQAQTPDYPNAVNAKVNLIDFGAMYDGELNITQGFEVGYFRNVAPFLNIGVPLKFGLAKLPESNVDNGNGNTKLTSADLVFQLINIKDEAKVVPYAIAGAGYALEDFKNGHVQLPFGAGVHFRVSKYAFVNLQGEFRKAFEDNRDNIQVGLGFVTMLHKSEAKPAVQAVTNVPDRDKDGIADTQDFCPDDPGPATTMGCPDRDGDGVADNKDACPDDSGPEALMGCPDYDNDGVADKDDNCPTDPGPVANNGCPESVDTDGDGFADDVDECPVTAGPVNGCPDRDNDGVSDKNDDCPDTPGVTSNNGCPLAADRDNDGVPDAEDACPDKAGPFSGCPDTDGDGVADNLDKCPTTAGPSSNFGCPEVRKETKETLASVTKNVQFESGSAVLTQPSYAVLDQLVDVMRQYPDYTLSIAGHTDNVGDARKNLQLSEERAKACYDYLVFRAIHPERLRYAGFGQNRPVADNNSAEGQKMNRRVDFELVLDK
jgi:outer membrane protein OmpA-like peptidoglycan-associated protein